MIAGCSFKGRSFQPAEAAEAAMSVCNLGSEVVLGHKSEDHQIDDRLKALLKKHSVVKLFQAGWRIIYANVVLYTAKALLEFLNHLKDEKAIPRQMRDIAHMTSMLRFCILFNRPWEFNEHMDDLQTVMDGETIVTLAALLQEFPVLTGSICLKGDHTVSPFISSKSHIRTVRQFLGDVL